jgi:hypothetical protein
VLPLSIVTAAAGRPPRALAPARFTTLKMPDPTSHCTPQTRCSGGGDFLETNLFGCEEFNHYSLLHARICNIGHFELLVRCAHVTDPSATLDKLETSAVQSVTRAVFCCAASERKTLGGITFVLNEFSWQLELGSVCIKVFNRLQFQSICEFTAAVLTKLTSISIDLLKYG